MEAKSVANNAYPVLCGGTCFTLVLEARGRRTSQRSRYKGEQDGLSNSYILAGLGRVVYTEYIPPKNKRSFTTSTNAYRSCTDNGSNLNFLFQDSVSAFDNRVKTQYPQALKAMCDFTDRFLEVGTSIKKEVWLTKAILELIENDASIAESQELFICSGGQGITKCAIRQMSDFVLQPFLLGVWHYVVANKPDNKSGQDTFDRWCPPRDRAERKYEGDMGNRIVRDITIEMLAHPTDEAIAESEMAATMETTATEADKTIAGADPKRITVNNYGIVQNQKFISVETMNGDINL